MAVLGGLAAAAEALAEQRGERHLGRMQQGGELLKHISRAFSETLKGLPQHVGKVEPSLPRFTSMQSWGMQSSVPERKDCFSGGTSRADHTSSSEYVSVSSNGRTHCAKADARSGGYSAVSLEKNLPFESLPVIGGWA